MILSQKLLDCLKMKLSACSICYIYLLKGQCHGIKCIALFRCISDFFSVHILVFLLWIIRLVFPFVFPTLKFHIFSHSYLRMIIV